MVSETICIRDCSVVTISKWISARNYKLGDGKSILICSLLSCKIKGHVFTCSPEVLEAEELDCIIFLQQGGSLGVLNN